jgi:hypothetical protein
VLLVFEHLPAEHPALPVTAGHDPGAARQLARLAHCLLRAIRENVDLSDHMADAVNSLRIVLAADESFRTGRVVVL